MKKVTHVPHPDYVKHLSNNPASRPARVEIKARGKTLVGERLYPKGSPSSDPASLMTTEELVQKFRRNAEGVIAPSRLDAVVDSLVNLEKVKDVGAFMRLMG